MRDDRSGAFCIGGCNAQRAASSRCSSIIRIGEWILESSGVVSAEFGSCLLRCVALRCSVTFAPLLRVSVALCLRRQLRIAGQRSCGLDSAQRCALHAIAPHTTARMRPTLAESCGNLARNARLRTRPKSERASDCFLWRELAKAAQRSDRRRA